MADTKHTVVRTDSMRSTDQRSALRSCRYTSDGNTATADVDNGRLVELVKLEKDQREVWIVKPATKDTKRGALALLCAPEIMADERKKNLWEFYNEKGDAIRGYVLHTGDIFSLSAEGFETVPTVDQTVGLGTDGKLKGGADDKLGKCIAIDTLGTNAYSMKMYVIEVLAPEAAASEAA